MLMPILMGAPCAKTKLPGTEAATKAAVPVPITLRRMLSMNVSQVFKKNDLTMLKERN
jgi:hypothetical protein